MRMFSFSGDPVSKSELHYFYPVLTVMTGEKKTFLILTQDNLSEFLNFFSIFLGEKNVSCSFSVKKTTTFFSVDFVR